MSTIAVPDTDTFNLLDIVKAVDDSLTPSTDDLLDAFTESDDRPEYWNPEYMGNKNELNDWRDWKEPIAPVVYTNAAVDMPASWNLFEFRGELISFGSGTPMGDVGFVWSTTNTDPKNGEPGCTTDYLTGPLALGAYSLEHFGYENTTYYFRAVAYNGVHILMSYGYGTVEQFTVGSDPEPVIKTLGANKNPIGGGSNKIDTIMNGDLEKLGFGDYAAVEIGFIDKLVSAGSGNFEYGDANVTPYVNSTSPAIGTFNEIGRMLANDGTTYDYRYRSYVEQDDGNYIYGDIVLVMGMNI